MTKLDYLYNAGYVHQLSKAIYEGQKKDLGILWYLFLFKKIISFKDYGIFEKFRILFTGADSQKKLVNNIRKTRIDLFRDYYFNHENPGLFFSKKKDFTDEEIRGLFSNLDEVVYTNQYCADCFIKNGDNVLDVGGNIGIFSIFVKELFGKCKIVVFEPEKSNFRLLKKNLSEYSGITLINKAVGNKVRKEKLRISNNFSCHTLSEDKNFRLKTGFVSEQLVSVTTLDTVIKNKIDVIKIDVEGYESEVIRGAKNTILKNFPILLVAYEHYKNQDKDLVRLVRSIDRNYKHLILNNQVICFYDPRQHKKKIENYQKHLAIKK